jgi:hypothetical protein
VIAHTRAKRGVATNLLLLLPHSSSLSVLGGGGVVWCVYSIFILPQLLFF